MSIIERFFKRFGRQEGSRHILFESSSESEWSLVHQHRWRIMGIKVWIASGLRVDGFDAVSLRLTTSICDVTRYAVYGGILLDTLKAAGNIVGYDEFLARKRPSLFCDHVNQKDDPEGPDAA
jgi:hypothetical protein